MTEDDSGADPLENAVPRDPFTPVPSDAREALNEERTETVCCKVTPTMKTILDELAHQGRGVSRSSLVNEAVVDYVLGLLDASDDTDLTASQLNYLAQRRAQRDQATKNRIHTFKKRVDETIQNRINWGTPPREVADTVRSFQTEAQQYHDAGFIADETYQEYLQYLHQQFRDYAPAQEESEMNREDRSAAYAMSGPKTSQEYKEELGFAVGNYIRAVGGLGLPERRKLRTAKDLAEEAASMEASPADKTEQDVIVDAKTRAIEGPTLCDESPLLEQAADYIAQDREKAARDLCVQMADFLVPNDLDWSDDYLLKKARQRAESPDPQDQEDNPTADPRVQTALDAVELEAQDIDATGEVASPSSPSPTDPLTGSRSLADADGGQLSDGDGHDDEQ